MPNRNWTLVASASLLGLAAPTMAQAQSEGEAVPSAAPAPTQANATIADNAIVVTARRRSESAQDVPLVVNAVTSEDLDKFNIREFEDVESLVPGLSLDGNSNGIGQVSTLRGIQFDVNASGANGTIEFYRNDAPLTGGAVFQGLYDISQIEVLRGPQGTLRGRASPSGAVNVTTRKPDLYEAGGYMEGTVNDEGEYNTNGAVNVPVLEGKLGVRVAGLLAEGEGDRVTVPGGKDPMRDTGALRASVSADPLDGVLLLDFNFETINQEILSYRQLESLSEVIDAAAASPVTIRAKDRRAGSILANDIEQDYKIYNWKAELSQFGQQLVYVGSHVSQDIRSIEPFDKADLFDDPFDPGGTPYSQLSLVHSDSTSHELRLQNQDMLLGMFDYVVGGFVYDTNSLTDFTRPSATGVLVPKPDITQITGSRFARYNTAKEESIFGNLTLHLGDDTEVSGGLRRIWYQIDSGLLFGGPGGVDIPQIRRAVKEGDTIYSASIKHRFTDDLMVYASTGSSWRPSNVAVGGPSAPSDLQVQYTTIQPETSKSYEIGVKSNWFDNRLLFNLTAYYQEFENYPYRSPNQGVYAIDRARNAVVPFNYVASVPAEVKGIEAEIGFRPLSNWSINGVVSYADSKIKNGEIPCLDLNDDGMPDNVSAPPSFAELDADVGPDNIDTCTTNARAGYQSPWTFTIQSEYFMPIADRMEGFARGLYTWRGNSQNDPNNDFDDVDAYGLLNLYLGVRDIDDAWEVALYGKNITDTFRVLNRTNGAATTVVNSQSVGTTNYFNIDVTPPREFGLTATFNFGSR